jgi:tetratricopeptide (TPR) repeat protein
VKTAGAMALLLAASAVAVPERWLHNPRERTQHAVAAWRRGDFAAAQQSLQQALELGGEDSRLEYNAGSGHLAAGAPGAAMPLLQRAAERPLGVSAADWQSLRPDAFYNLGNAQLAAGEVEAAIEAYRSCLRIAPDHQPAKHNLELALRQLPERPSPPQAGAGGEGGGPAPPDQRGEGGGEGEAGDGQRQPGSDGEGGEGDQQEEPPPGGGERGQRGRSPRLPDFDPQQDMSAEQAAALLEAVENLEREQRRAQAEELRMRRARQSGDRDW